MEKFNKKLRAILLLIGIVAFTIPTFATTADAGADKTLNITPSKKAVYLKGTGTGNAPLTYKWYEDDKYIGPHANRWYVITQSGEHNITLVVRDANGITATDTMVVTVNKVTANAGEDQESNSTLVHLNGSGTGKAPLKYKWYEKGHFIGEGQSYDYNISQNGQHEITLVVTDANGAKATDKVIVTINSGVDTPLTANAGPDKTLNITPSNRAIHLKGSGTGKAPLTYKWYESGKFIGTGVSRWYGITKNGQHEITLVVSDVDGNEANDTMIVTVNNGVPVVTADAGPDKILNIRPSHKSVYLKGSGTGVAPLTYRWNENNHYIGKGSRRWYRITQNGEHEITLTVTDANGNEAKDTMIVTVYNGEDPLDTTKPVITLLGDENVTLTVGDTYIDAGATATDDVDGDITANIKTTSDVNTSAEGIYTVTYEVSDLAGNDADVVTRRVMVNAKPGSRIIKKTGETSSGYYPDIYYQKGATPSYSRDDNKSIVIDHVTNLQWQDNDNVGGASNLDEAKNYCSNLNLGGYNDWRLPTITELLDITQYNNDGGLYLAPSEFKNPTFYSSDYIASSSVDYNGNVLHSSFFMEGSIISKSKGISTIRCVRGEQKETYGNFSKTGNIVTDSTTGLQWQDNEIVAKDWGEAVDYCESLNLDGYSDWRLPNIKELISLLDYREDYPAISRVFEHISTISTAYSDETHQEYEYRTSDYWSFTSNSLATDGSWHINFMNGKIYPSVYLDRIGHYDTHGSKMSKNAVRCVRAGQ